MFSRNNVIWVRLGPSPRLRSLFARAKAHVIHVGECSTHFQLVFVIVSSYIRGNVSLDYTGPPDKFLLGRVEGYRV